MGFHTFDPSKADRLDDVSRYRFCSREELLGGLGVGSENGEHDDTHLVDLGSGTGFYTAALAPFVGRVSAVDIQPEMHDLFRENGVPDNVELVESSTDSLPLGDSMADAAVSTMTAHELPLASTLTELKRVLDLDSPVVVVDWSSRGRGEAGPPLSERRDAEFVADTLADADFTVETATERGETFFVQARS